MEKLRKGALTLGAFNVLVVDGLVVNMPPAGQPASARQAALRAGLKTEVFAEAFLHSQGYAPGRFSGLRINGLSVNRCGSNGGERLFSAERADSDLRSKGLKLRACTVFSSGGTERRVTSALWVPEPSPAHIFREGGVEQRIPCE